MSGIEQSTRRYTRVPLVAITVFGLGGLVALAVGVVLYLGMVSTTRSTGRLLVGQSEALIDAMEQRVRFILEPAREQARWIAAAVASGEVDLNDTAALDQFIRGTLGATPHIAGIAITTPAGKTRRWRRNPWEVVDEDWSGRADIRAWLEAGATQSGATWRQPFWTRTIEQAVVLHDIPLRRGGQFLGMLGQIIPVSDLSRQLGLFYTQTGMTPFILYDRENVLAHPLLIDWTPDRTADSRNVQEAPLLKLGELGDGILEGIWSPDNTEPFFFGNLDRFNAGGSRFGDHYYVYLHRQVEGFGPAPWTIGAHVNTDLYGGEEVERLHNMLAAGGLIWLFAVITAVYVGKRASRPIQSFARVAKLVETQELSAVPILRQSRIREFDDASRSFNQMVQGLQDREVIRETLGRYLPPAVAGTLLSEGGELEARQVEGTILFCDLEGFTSLTHQLGPRGIVDVLNAFFSAMVKVLERYGGVVTQFQGDAILATFNVPLENPEHAANALRAATEMLRTVENERFAGESLKIRIGVNTGLLVAGAVGAQRRLSYTVHGDAVNLAARLEALNKEYSTRILVSSNTADRTSGFEFKPAGETYVRGQPVPVVLYELCV